MAAARHRGELAGVGAIVVLAAALRFYGIGHQGFWYDEADTALLLRFSAGQMLGLLPHTESTPPLYYCVAWVWVRVFGDTEAGLRSLSAVCGTLVVPVVYACARGLLGRRAAPVAALLTAVNPLLVWYSQEARAYMMLTLLSAVSLLMFVAALRGPSRGALAGWALASVLALATHYYAAALVVPEATVLIAVHRRRAVLVATGAIAVCGAALAVLAAEQAGTGNAAWIGRTSLRLRLAQIVPQFLLGTGTPARTPLKLVAFAIVAGAIGTLIWGLRRRNGAAGDGVARVGVRGAAVRGAGVPGAGVVALLAAGGAVLTLLGARSTLITRNVIELWVPAMLVVAAGFAAPRSTWGRRLGQAGTAGLCAIGLVAVVGVATDASLQRPDWRPVAAAINAGPPGTRLVLIQHNFDRLPLALYVPRLAYLRAPSAPDVAAIDVIAIRSPQQPLCWWGAACNLIPSTAQNAYRLPGFRIVRRRRIAQFTLVELVATRARTLTRSELAGALTETTLARDGLLIQRSAAG